MDEATIAAIEAIARDTIQRNRGWLIERPLLEAYALIDGAMQVLLNRKAPPIISGYRSPEKQRELLQRWENGDPGVAYKPARRSWHLTGRAFDLQYRDDAFARLWVILGGRDGIEFNDPTHFYAPTGSTPPAAW